VTAVLIGVVAGLAAVSTALALAAPAQAQSAYAQVLAAYERTGTVAPCQFGAGELQHALSGVDTYGAQYFADFTQAIEAALTARAGGQCAATTASPPPAAGSTPAGVSAAVARLPAVTAATSAGLPAPLVVLGGLAVVLAVGAGSSLLLRSARERDRDRPAEHDLAPAAPGDADRS
jgi:hypothetical protein